MSNAGLLEQTVFDTKDSATLEKLFAKTLTYEHSSGKVETREQALQGIIHNKSIYVPSIEPHPYGVIEKGDSIIVKKMFAATEKKADGTESILNLTIETVWIKENGDWKLIRRKATKNL
ncbi:MAG: nuclear transport factor 2 family protein [Bacteroidota bacterium]